MRKISSSHFGAFVIQAVEEGGRTCINGLPLVSPTVRMLGRFQYMRTLYHENLCQYLDLQRCCLAKNLVILISECYEQTLEDLIISSNRELDLLPISLQIADALEYLHNAGYIHGKCDLSSIYIVPNDDENKDLKIRMSKFCLSFITDLGRDADFASDTTIFNCAPENFQDESERKVSYTEKSDVWSFGITLMQLYLRISFEKVWTELQFTLVLKKCFEDAEGNRTISLFSYLQHMNAEIARNVNNRKIEQLIEKCLRLIPSERPSISEVKQFLTDALHHNMQLENEFDEFEMIDPVELKGAEEFKTEDHLKYFREHQMSLKEAFFLWKNSGASCETILTRKGIIELRSPITTLPVTVIEDFVLFGNEELRFFEFDHSMTILPDIKLREKLKTLNIEDIVVPYRSGILKTNDASVCRHHSTDGLTVLVKEKDVVYQTLRMIEFRNLLESCEYGDKKEILRKKAFVDIPPVFRQQVWQILLDVSPEDLIDFETLNTIDPHSSDRQLDVDIPRCHQYEDLMTSPAAHATLRRILKAWLLSNENYVYWQGCDSLAAPFMLLNFNNPEIALACMNKFVNRYLYNFFLQDNSVIIQECLAIFNHLLAYLDAALYTHLEELGFFPELYAIPWFLTCFAHVLPMSKLFHVWDQILLHDSSFPLMIGLAIMKSLRPRLIVASFNDAILLFSDLPDLTINKVIDCSLEYYESVPPSCCFRSHDTPWKDSNLPIPHSLAMDMQHFTVAELKKMHCPRVSINEFRWRVLEQKIVVIDVRNNIDFARGRVIGSINYPNVDDDSFKNVASVFTIAQENKHPICIIWGKDFETAIKFSTILVNRHINGVCILDVGFEGIRDERSLISMSY